jgi:hypothetical protein
MPSSVKDRFTVDFEYLFFFSKNKKYYFEQQFEPLKKVDTTRTSLNGLGNGELAGNLRFGSNGKQRNMRTVWNISTKPYKGVHFAVFPEELIETPILAGCPQYVCKECGKPRVRLTKHNKLQKEGEHKVDFEKTPYSVQKRKGWVAVRDLPKHDNLRIYLQHWRNKAGYTIQQVEDHFGNQAGHHWFEKNGSYPSIEDWKELKALFNFDDTFDDEMLTEYYKPAEKQVNDYSGVGYSDCGCNAGFQPGVVLDPFIGSGTTAAVSKRLNRNYVGIELNPEYHGLIHERLDKTARIKPLSEYELKMLDD